MGLGGLPNFYNYTEGHVMHMLHFGATVLQVFSDNFSHPCTGAVMGKVINLKNAEKLSMSKISKPNEAFAEVSDKRSDRERISSDRKSDQPSSSGASSTSERRDRANRTYSMRIGIACGPAIVGVLQGKTPLFDCWGPTINLAARLESTGSPSYMQCSEDVYNRVKEKKESPYSWDKPRTIYAKGFGNLTAYFANKTARSVPIDLIDALDLQVDFKDFAFGNATGPKVRPEGAPSHHHVNNLVLDKTPSNTDVHLIFNVT
eukprot:NODE_2963_length_1451_cov_27.959337_g2568_i0.p1 GENE.NODE_2963_length_1451_cov_27.959337_g2568_i0~~NODE_2963_length_1451_cov_27.959337_g2568_i0.p1  ORF type:complete len:288 (+),score=80.39 NODE_2963_length_1451_cov_27.959337_g2568_i0:86-865(+)